MAAHRYWRVYITGVTGTSNGHVSFSEIELRNSSGGADLTGSGTASASSVFDGSFTADKAVDNNTSTSWHCQNGATTPHWWKYDFGSGNSYNIVEIAITPRDGGLYTQAPTTFSLQYSDDGSNWAVSHSFTTSWSSGSAQTFTVSTEFARLTQYVVEVIVGSSLIYSLTSDSLSLSDAVETSVGGVAGLHTISIAESITLTEGSVKTQRKNAPNIPIIAFDAFGDAFQIVGDFGLQLDTMRGQEFVWDISDVFNLTDAIYSSEYIEIAAGSDFALTDEIAIGAGIEVYDSMQDVWDPEAEIDIEVALAVPMTISVSDALSFTDEIAFVRQNGRELEDRFALVDSVRVRGAHGLSATGDLIALSDALEIGWNPSVDISDALSFDDAGGVSTLMPSWINVNIPVEGFSLFDGDFSTQGTEVFLGGTRLSYLRRYLNDVPR